MDLRCQYASTHCPNTRSLKISGELHRFCLFHRRSANAAQRRWKQKKLAAASGSEDEAIAKPAKESRPRRRLRREPDDAAIKTERSTAAKRRRTISSEIAAPRFVSPVEQTSAIELPPLELSGFLSTLEIDALPPLFADDDMDQLNKLVFDADLSIGVPEELAWEVALPLPEECWWNDVAAHRKTGMIVQL